MTLGFLVNMSREKITDVHIPISRNSSLWRYAFIYFVGEGAADKALQLNGSDMGGWTVDAEALPFPEEDDNCVALQVKGYDTLLSESDIKCELSKLFSSCGKIDDVRIYEGFSIVYLVGEDAVDKAPKLSGTDMGGGHKVVVRFVAYHGRTIVHPRRHKGRIICGRPSEKPKMAGKEEDKKPQKAQKKKIIKKPKMTAKKKILKKPKMTAKKKIIKKPKMTLE
ncbi:unnamed protein product [Arabidopsis halleri]